MDEILSKDKQLPVKRESIGIWLTNACNLNCTYCYIHNKSEDTITVSKAMHILSKELLSSGLPVEIDFMGAEPLTRFDVLREIVENIKAKEWNRPYVFMAATNGTLLNDEMKEWFFTNRNIMALGLSYDGEKSQPINRTKENIKIDTDFFLKTWPQQPWKITISEETAFNIDTDLIALHEKNIPFTANAAYEGHYWSEEAIAAYEMSLFHLADYYVKNPHIKRCNLFRLPLCYTYGNTNAPQPCYCSAGQSFRFYDMDGSVYPCHMFSEVACEKGKSIQGLSWLKGADFEDPACKNCMLKGSCYTCIGSNWIYRGNIRLRDPLHCRLYQAQIRAMIHMITESCKGRSDLSNEELQEIRAAIALRQGFREGKIGMKETSSGHKE